MRTITKITQQKRVKTRLNIFLDGAFAFSVSEAVYIDFHLYKGKQISEEEIQAIKEADQEQAAYMLALNYLSYRMRSIEEIRTYLIGKEMDASVIDTVLRRLSAEALVDDDAFASAFVRDRIHRSLKGPGLIRQELSKKGIDGAAIERGLQQYQDELQREKVRAILEKELKKKSKVGINRRKEQLTNKVLQRGFDREIVMEIISKLEITYEEEEQFILLKKEADKLYNKYKSKYDGYECQMRIKQGLYRRGFDLGHIERYMKNLFAEE